MSKRVLSIILAVLIAATVGFVVAKADVDGTFDVVIQMKPNCPETPADLDTHIRGEEADILTLLDDLADLIADMDLALVNVETDLDELLWKASAMDDAQTADLGAYKAEIETAIAAITLADIEDKKIEIEEAVIELIFKLWQKKLNGRMSLDDFVTLVQKLLPIILAGEEIISQLPDATWTAIMDEFELPTVSDLDDIDVELAVVMGKIDVALLRLDEANTALGGAAPDWTAILMALTGARGAIVFARQKLEPIPAKVVAIIDIVDEFSDEFEIINPPPVDPLPGETCKMDFDFEAWLTLNITLSGLTISQDLVFGMAGIEHYIFDVQTILGALELYDEFAFAAPYVGVYGTYMGDYFFNWISPYTGGYRIGPLLFVKKRVTAEITIGGLSFKNLAMLEDVNFPDPKSSAAAGMTSYTAADQAFGFGDIMTISGTTISGISVTTQAGFCADWRMYTYYPKHQLLKYFEYDYNRIKKKVWYETVQADCWKGIVDEETGAYKPVLMFTKEIIAIQGIPLPSGITLDWVSVFSTVPYKLAGYPWNINPKYATYSPGTGKIPFFTDLVLQVPVMGMADFLIELWTDDIDSLWIDKMILTLQLPEHGYVIHWYDNDGDLTMTAADDVFLKGGFSFQDAVSANFFGWLIPTVGFYEMELNTIIPISWPAPYGNLEFLWLWAWDGEKMAWSEWGFKLYKEFDHNDFEIKAVFDKYGFRDAAIDISVFWSI